MSRSRKQRIEYFILVLWEVTMNLQSPFTFEEIPNRPKVSGDQVSDSAHDTGSLQTINASGMITIKSE